jgi:hypothetical protein
MECVTAPPLKALHGEASLIQVKLETFSRVSTAALIESLGPGQLGALKTRPDGTVIDGHHRVKVLRDRGVDVDTLPREIIPKEE